MFLQGGSFWKKKIINKAQIVASQTICFRLIAYFFLWFYVDPNCDLLYILLLYCQKIQLSYTQKWWYLDSFYQKKIRTRSVLRGWSQNSETSFVLTNKKGFGAFVRTSNFVLKTDSLVTWPLKQNSVASVFCLLVCKVHVQNWVF